MNTPTPALVSKEAVKRLPRLPLALLCLAYLVPGLVGRDPWKNADVTAFGFMANMARGLSSWWEPMIGGVAGPGNVLPYWIGATAIRLWGPWLGEAVAARLPFALMLAFVLWATWTAAYYLARTEAAQPAPFAFGGEAPLVDYARAMGDAALLALIATLGLLQLGHETTPELAQLCGVCLYLVGVAKAPFRPLQSRVAILLGLPVLASSGSPAFARAAGGAGHPPLPALGLPAGTRLDAMARCCHGFGCCLRHGARPLGLAHRRRVVAAPDRSAAGVVHLAQRHGRDVDPVALAPACHAAPHCRARHLGPARRGIEHLHGRQ